MKGVGDGKWEIETARERERECIYLGVKLSVHPLPQFVLEVHVL